jgi:hypothetical protein
MDLFWTPTEVAAFGTLGAIAVGLIAFAGSRLGSRDVRDTAKKVLRGQREIAELQLEEQRRQFEISRMHVFADRQADAYQGVIGALLSGPNLVIAEGTSITISLIIESYLDSLNKWSGLLAETLVPLYTFADKMIFTRVNDFVNTVSFAAEDLANQAAQMTNTFAQDGKGDLESDLEQVLTRCDGLLHVDKTNLLNVLREAVQAAPTQFFNLATNDHIPREH